MIYIGDENYWNNKFYDRGSKVLEPDQMLVMNLEHLTKGRVLDLACGDGRNSLFLMENGFDVTGVDFSQEALMRLERFSDSKGYDVSTFQRDLTHKESLKNLGVFDCIIVNHYRLSEQIIKDIPNVLKSKGTLLISGFSKKHKTDDKIKDSDLIRFEDFRVIKDKLELIKEIETEDARGSFITYIFKCI